MLQNLYCIKSNIFIFLIFHSELYILMYVRIQETQSPASSFDDLWTWWEWCVRELWTESRLQCVEAGMAQYVETTVSEGWTVKWRCHTGSRLLKDIWLKFLTLTVFFEISWLLYKAQGLMAKSDEIPGMNGARSLRRCKAVNVWIVP